MSINTAPRVGFCKRMNRPLGSEAGTFTHTREKGFKQHLLFLPFRSKNGCSNSVSGPDKPQYSLDDCELTSD